MNCHINTKTSSSSNCNLLVKKDSLWLDTRKTKCDKL